MSDFLTPEAKERIQQKSDYELIDMITLRREEYMPVAISLAEATLKNRGVGQDVISAYKEKALSIRETKVTESTVVLKRVRLTHLYLDTIGFVLYTYVFIIIIEDLLLPFGDLGAALLFVFLYLSYYCVFEFGLQATPAKLFTRCIVVREDGGKPSFKQILLRSIYRLFPIDPISFLFFEGIHDRFSHTRVIRKSSTKQHNNAAK